MSKRKPKTHQDGRLYCSDAFKITGLLVVFCVIMVTLNFRVYTKHPSPKRLSDSSMLDNFIRTNAPKFQSRNKNQVVHLEELLNSSPNNNQKSKNEIPTAKDAKPPLETNGIRYHLVFSTDCSAYQHWQSYVLFHSALMVGQPGRVTRIASGCNDAEARETTKWHHDHITNVMSDRFGLHLTPHFSKADTGKDYKFFNKPMGFLHWFDNDKWIRDEQGRLDDDAVVILTDPDMILLRPITNDFTNKRNTLLVTGTPTKNTRVTHGTIIAQRYGFGASWQNRNIPSITGDPHSPAQTISRGHAGTFAAGPPYVGTARDMHALAEKWVEYVPKVYAEHPFLMAEMYAYSIAAAHLELGHGLVRSMMVSSISDSGEAWAFVDDIPKEEVCGFAMHPDERKFPIPNVLHYCQRVGVGMWFFGKRRMPGNFLTCDSPLLKEPPANLATLYDYWTPPPPHKPPGEKKPLGDRVRRSAYLLCGMIAAVNRAASFYKSKHCSGVEGTSIEKTMELFKT